MFEAKLENYIRLWDNFKKFSVGKSIQGDWAVWICYFLVVLFALVVVGALVGIIPRE